MALVHREYCTSHRSIDNRPGPMARMFVTKGPAVDVQPKSPTSIKPQRIWQPYRMSGLDSTPAVPYFPAPP